MNSLLILTQLVILFLVGLGQSIMVNEFNRTPPHRRNATRNSTIITHQSASSGGSLRDVFDFFFDSSNRSEDVTPRPSFISKAHSSTFRPSSSILYLTPPKPRHIASIHSSLESIELDRKASHLILSWSVIVILKPNATQPKVQKRQIVSGAIEEAPANQTSAVAKVEEERNPLKWIIHIRRYGEPNRERFQIIDRENTLDPPYTGNKTYHHKLTNFRFHTDSSYEVCIQSVNGGKMQESESLKQAFPVDAQTELAGKSNPLFVCKEVLIKKQPEPEVEQEVELINRNNNQIRGRLAEGASGEAHIEVSEEAQDAFVVYTAITSGSTTVLLLIVVALFCCCKCNQKKNKQNEYHHHYNRAPSADSAYY